MSAMESMIRTVLASMDIDVEAMKGEVTTRIVAFENNVRVLNNSLIAIHQKQAQLDADMATLFAHFNIERPTANQEKTNDNNANGANATRIAGAIEHAQSAVP